MEEMRTEGLPWYFNGFCKETDKFFTTKFATVPEIGDCCDKVIISSLLDYACGIVVKKLARNFKLALPFYYHNSETDERKMQLLVPLYFPGASVRLALVLNKVIGMSNEYDEG